MTTCSLQRSLWTVVIVGLFFAAFIVGTQVPIQFTIGKRAENVPETMIPQQPITSAGFNTPALPTTVAFNDVVTPPVAPSIVEPPMPEPPVLNNTPTSIPPVQEPNVPSMQPAVTPIPTPHQGPLPTPIPLPQVAVTKGNDPEQIPPPGPAPESPEPASLEGKQLEECCLTQSIKSNLEFLKVVVAQKTSAEKELAECSTTLKQRLNRANEELSNKDTASDKEPVPESPAAETIDQLIARVKQLRANKTMFEGQMSVVKGVIRTQFDELKKQVIEMGVDVNFLPQ